jgi:DNA-binding response OmpR family regulator
MSAQAKPLILVVEDDTELADLLAEQLEMAGMTAQVYNKAAPVAAFLGKNFANLMLLDVNLPDQSGFALLEELKKLNVAIPTIFLTGADSEVNRVKGLDLGGDDYIIKPFSFPELVARINAVLRRAETSRDLNLTKNVRISEEPFVFCSATVHPDRLDVDFSDQSVEKIGKKELGILAYLVHNPATVITRKAIIHAVWGIHADVRSRSLDQYVVKIRNLFIKHKTALDAFKTIHGVGYLYDPENVVKLG